MSWKRPINNFQITTNELKFCLKHIFRVLYSKFVWLRMVLNAFEWKSVSFWEKHSTTGYFYSRCEKRRCNSICGFDFLCIWRHHFTGLDLTFLSYNMWRLIITKCYENLKWIITMKVQIARHFAILTFCYICVHLILKSVLFFRFHRGNIICIFHPAVMNYKKRYGSQLWVFFSFGVWKPVFNIITLFCGFPSSMSAAFVWRAFSKIKHLPPWQLFWIFICQTLHIQTTWSQFFFST